MHAHGGGLFDHNLHALRIVEDFELRYAAFRGLNLTFEVREGIIKHSHDYRAEGHPELADYLLDHQPPLEAQLIDLADEIAYNTADLDDGYEAKILKVDRIRAGVPVFDRFYREVEARYPDALEKLKFNEALKGIFNRLVTDLIDNTAARVRAAGIETLDDLRRCGTRLVSLSDTVEAERAQCKQFLYDNLYNSEDLASEKLNAERIVGELFAFWMRHPEKLPGTYRHKAEREPLARVVCDYIAGMTDNFILEQHAKLV
jgi:dGTPase